ncbi:heme oxygenase (biliverdin-producing) [Actinophytocola oryzae]|uniref:Heme oxygenase n=1 Tax=Actinophytocola oryzae TaxID=502181 RepID=A0A4R7UWP0_9PSEU|nr:biliverdin-producing heme oxygenase [Actinophytocola oryzae]TDV38671.1 heme oxygenase [Actinophytocola oryzae]
MTDLALGSLSTRLRDATKEEHERTESSPFVVALMAGELDRNAYAAMLGQTYLFYVVIEEAGERWRGDAVVGSFVSDALLRRDALEADLAWLFGPGWRDEVAPLPATSRYIDRLRQVCFSSRSGFVAHHYTRYLGDLSGGQIIRAKLRSLYGLTGDGVRFYVFDQIAKPKVFKDDYRALIDTAEWAAGEPANLLAEANEAFRLNRGVFDDLGKALGVGWVGSCEQ